MCDEQTQQAEEPDVVDGLEPDVKWKAPVKSRIQKVTPGTTSDSWQPTLAEVLACGLCGILLKQNMRS